MIPRIRCTQAEKETITEKANFFGVSVPEYLRRLALGKPLIPAIDQDMLSNFAVSGHCRNTSFLREDVSATKSIQK